LSLDLPHDSSVVVRNSGSFHAREPGCHRPPHGASARRWRVPELPELRARRAPMTIDPEPGTQPIPVQVAEPTTAPHIGTVGLWQGSALYVASVLGTGILTLPALTAAVAGPASILAIIAVL